MNDVNKNAKIDITSSTLLPPAIELLYDKIQRLHSKSPLSGDARHENGHPVAQHNELTSILQPYQCDAVQWMLHQELTAPRNFHIQTVSGPGLSTTSVTRHPGGILADEMGLGKTLEILSLILSNPNVEAKNSTSILSSDVNVEIRIVAKNAMEDVDLLCLCSKDTATPIVVMETKVKPGKRASAKVEKKIQAKKPRLIDNNVQSVAVKQRHSRNCENEVLIRCQQCGQWQHAACVGMLLAANYWQQIQSKSQVSEVTEDDRINEKMLRNYRCSQCWSKCTLESGATLIVCPDHILDQWRDEIITHVRLNALKIMIYHGRKRKLPNNKKENPSPSLDGTVSSHITVLGGEYVQPSRMASADIVLITYSVLRQEIYRHQATLGESEEVSVTAGQQRRLKQAYLRPGCPLSCIHWWRICLDESQLLGNSTTKVAQMAQDLKAEYRWMVTGTPIPRGLRDIAGLLAFLKVEPFQCWHTLSPLVKSFLQRYNFEGTSENEDDKESDNVVRENEEAVEAPATATVETDGCPKMCDTDKPDGVEEDCSVTPLVELLSHFLWRNTKILVADQLNLPSLTEAVHFVTSTPTEKFFYHRVLNDHKQLFVSTFPEAVSNPLHVFENAGCALHLSRVIQTLRLVTVDPCLVFSRTHRQNAEWCNERATWNRCHLPSSTKMALMTGKRRHTNKSSSPRKATSSLADTTLNVTPLWLDSAEVTLDNSGIQHMDTEFGPLAGRLLSQTPGSMGDTLERVQDSIKTQLRDAVREWTFYKNGMAGYAILSHKPTEAAMNYCNILEEAQRIHTSYGFQVDSSQRLHALVNLHRLLTDPSCDVNLTNIVHTQLPESQSNLMQGAQEVRAHYLQKNMPKGLSKKIEKMQETVKKLDRHWNTGTSTTDSFSSYQKMVEGVEDMVNEVPPVNGDTMLSSTTWQEWISQLQRNHHSLSGIQTGATSNNLNSKSWSGVMEMLRLQLCHTLDAFYSVKCAWTAVTEFCEALHTGVELSPDVLEVYLACTHYRPWMKSRYPLETLSQTAFALHGNNSKVAVNHFCAQCALHAAKTQLALRLFLWTDRLATEAAKKQVVPQRQVIIQLLAALPSEGGRGLKKMLPILQAMETVCKTVQSLDKDMEEWWKFYPELDSFVTRMQTAQRDGPAYVHPRAVSTEMASCTWGANKSWERVTDLEQQYRYLSSSLAATLPECPICLATLTVEGDKSEFVLLQRCWHGICSPCFNILQEQQPCEAKCVICRRVLGANWREVRAISYTYQEWQQERERLAPENSEERMADGDDETSAPELFNQSSKINAVLKAIFDLRKNEESMKVVVFSEWRSVLYSILSCLQRTRHIGCSYLFHPYQRESLDQFRHSAHHQVLLLPLDLANNGLNLTEANHVFFVDGGCFLPHQQINNGNISGGWSRDFAREMQAISRIYRIGQTRPCTVVRFVTKNTAEEFLMQQTCGTAPDPVSTASTSGASLQGMPPSDDTPNNDRVDLIRKILDL